MDQPKQRRGRGLLLEAQHQLRQPLNALSLLIGELHQGPSGRDAAAVAEDMRHALQLANAWLDALADLETAEQGLLAPALQTVPLQAVFDKLRQDFAPRFAEDGLGFRVVATRARVRADPILLRRLLAALLDNAAKFTPAGRVLLGCRRAGEALRVEVWDSGPGIDPAETASLFEPFVRLENEVRPRERGLGIGLTYARLLAALADDRLTVSSRPGRGTCFAVTLQPATRLDGAAAAEAPLPDPAAVMNPLQGAEVLLTAGPEAVALRRRLESWGAEVRLLDPGGLVAALAEGPPLLIAAREVFEAAGAPSAQPETTLVLVGDAVPAGATAVPGVHSLQRPVRPARLRALCHFALRRAAEGTTAQIHARHGAEAPAEQR